MALHTSLVVPSTAPQVTRVDEPSKYGVVVHDHAGRIQHFVEKPQVRDAMLTNARDGVTESRTYVPFSDAARRRHSSVTTLTLACTSSTRLSCTASR